MFSSTRRRTLLDAVHSDLSLRSLSRGEGLALGTICLATLLLLVALQHDRVFFGDEIGTLRYLKKNSSYILTHFSTWLSMNYFILVERWVSHLFDAADWRLTLLPITGGIAIIPLAASLALKFTGSTRTALIAATLAAFNPYLLYWAPVIRSYSLLMAFSLLAINEFFHWYWRRDWWSGVRCAAAVLLLLLAHLSGVYTVAFLILLLTIETIFLGWFSGRMFLWQARTLWIPLAVVAMIVALAYWRLLPDIARVNREWGTDTPPTSIAYLPLVFVAYMGPGYAAWLSALLVLAGFWSAIRERQALLLLCGAIILGPIMMSLQGVSVNTSAYARYLIFSLPLLLILMAAGIDWLARLIRQRRTASIVGCGLAALVVLCWTPKIRAQFLVQKQWPLAKVAQFLHSQMGVTDVIVTGWATGFTLEQFFNHPEKCIMQPDNYLGKVANRLDDPASGRVFYVTGPGMPSGRTAHVERIGQAEVAIYSGKTVRALLEEWREDLRHRTAGVVYAPFHNDYQLLALLEDWLPSDGLSDHWRDMAERCWAQSSPARDVPRHLEKATRAVLFP